mgnify:CR=1 FL=1|jgi:hypothetical protein
MSVKELMSKMTNGGWLMFRAEAGSGIHYLMTGLSRCGVNSEGIIQGIYSDGVVKKVQASEFFLNIKDPTLLDFAAELSTQEPQGEK